MSYTLSQTAQEVEINKAYVQGYNRGLKDGEREGLVKRYTPNQIREILGLPRVEKSEKKEDNAFDNGEFDKFVDNLNDQALNSSDRINAAIFASLEALALAVKELDRRTR